ncbi:MAG TPA: amidohydrolase family protein [Opitutus sp.]|nr:amidohydrolase family protein [Opitutus sp.]
MRFQAQASAFAKATADAAGMSPADALFAATRNAADLIGASDRIGSIQPGRFADLVATTGDPLANPAQFRHVDFVMKGGVVFRWNGNRPSRW